MKASSATLYTACTNAGSTMFLPWQHTTPRTSPPRRVSATVHFCSRFRIEEKCTSLLDNLPSTTVLRGASIFN